MLSHSISNQQSSAYDYLEFHWNFKMPTEPDGQVMYTKFLLLCQLLSKLLNFKVLSVPSTFLCADSLQCL
jgi:hypothetical protein